MTTPEVTEFSDLTSPEERPAAPVDSLTLAGEFSLPRGVLIRGLVVDARPAQIVLRTSDKRRPLRVYDYLGNPLRQSGDGGRGLGDWRGLALDTRRDLYLAPAFGQLSTVTREGDLHRHIATPGAMLRGVAYMEEDDLYVVTEYDHKVSVLDPRTEVVIRSFGCRGDGPGELLYPSSVAPYHAGGRSQVAVSDFSNRRVQVFDLATGAHVRCFGVGVGEEGALGCVKDVIVQDGDACSTFDHDPQRVAVDPAGRVLVCDTWRERVVAYWGDDSCEREYWKVLLSGGNPVCVGLDVYSQTAVLGWQSGAVSVYNYGRLHGNVQSRACVVV